MKGSSQLFEKDRAEESPSSVSASQTSTTRHNWAHVIACGAFLRAAATFLVAFSSTSFQVGVILLCFNQFLHFV
jgi:hypothetical protein